jgi:DNA-binding NarL/FixJ family response regulator
MRRVLVLSDRWAVIEDVRAAVRRAAGLNLVEVAPARTSAQAALRRVDPHVVLIDDTGAPDLALHRIREVAARAPNAKCVILATAMDEATLKPKFEAGADAAIAGNVDSGTVGRLLTAIVEERVLQRPRWAAIHAGVDGHGLLTGRELAILRLVALGYTNARIARTLTVTEQTVKFHLKNVYRKLGVVNRTGASRYAYSHRLVLEDRHPDEAAGIDG